MTTQLLPLSDSERARAQRVDALTTLGPASIPELLEMLTDPNWVVRRSVVAALASFGDAAVGPLCELLMRQRNDETRLAAAVDALVASTGEVEPMVEQKLAVHPAPPVVADAAQILGRRRERASVPVLIQLLAHPDDNVAVAATEALGRVGGRAAVDALIHSAQSGNFFRVFPTIDVLGRSGDPRAVAALEELLGQPMYAAEAARALGRTGERSAVAPLAGSLVSSSETLVRVAAVSLADLHRRHKERYGEVASIEASLKSAAPAPQAVRRLSQTLAGADDAERAAISLVLGIIGGHDAVAPLMRLVEAPGPGSEAAAEALQRLGRESEQKLIELLRTDDSARRRWLLPVVSRASATDAVVQCLQDPVPAVRTMACEALARIGNPAAVPALFERLTDANPGVVQAAVGAIQSLGSRDTERLGLEAVKSPSPNVRRAALWVLSYFGFSSALPFFQAALDDEDPRVRDAALQGLPLLEDRNALDLLLEATRSPDSRTRGSAMRALGFAAGDLRIEATLLRGLEDSDDWVRYYACQALGRLGMTSAVERVAKLLRDPAGQVRVAAVEALSHFEHPRATELLSRAACSDEEDVRRAALIGLGMSRSPESMGVLLEAAESPDAATRLVAISALSDFGDPRVTPVLSRAAADSEETVRDAAIGFLANRPGPAPTSALVALLGDPVRREGARAALAICAEGRVDALLALLEGADEELAPELTSALTRMRRGDAVAAIFRALETGNVAARKAAAGALAALGTRQALDALRARAGADPDPEVRRVCSLLLSQ